MHKLSRYRSLAISASLSIVLASGPLEAAPQAAVTQNCDDLDYGIKREGSPYHYTNPNEACGISLKLDGLPTKTGSGYKSSGFDACGSIKSATANLEGKLNDQLQGALGKIGDVVSPNDLDNIAAQAGVDASSLTNVMRDGVSIDGTLNSTATDAVSAVTTPEGREGVTSNIVSGAKDTLQNSVQEQTQKVQQGQVGGAATPGINSNSGNNDSSWSIFD